MRLGKPAARDDEVMDLIQAGREALRASPSAAAIWGKPLATAASAYERAVGFRIWASAERMRGNWRLSGELWLNGWKELQSILGPGARSVEIELVEALAYLNLDTGAFQQALGLFSQKKDLLKAGDLPGLALVKAEYANVLLQPGWAGHNPFLAAEISKQVKGLVAEGSEAHCFAISIEIVAGTLGVEILDLKQKMAHLKELCSASLGSSIYADLSWMEGRVAITSSEFTSAVPLLEAARHFYREEECVLKYLSCTVDLAEAFFAGGEKACALQVVGNLFPKIDRGSAGHRRIYTELLKAVSASTLAECQPILQRIREGLEERQVANLKTRLSLLARG